MKASEIEWRNTRHNSLDHTKPWKEASKKKASVFLLPLIVFNLVMILLVIPYLATH